MFTAQIPGHGPFMIRYPRGKGVMPEWHETMRTMEIGKGERLVDGEKVAALTLGPLGNKVLEAVESLKSQGMSVACYNMIFLKPIDEDILAEVGAKFKQVITVEDGTRNGGFGSAVLEYFADHDINIKVKRLGLPDKFVEHGTPDELYKLCGLDSERIEKVIREAYENV